MDISHLPKSPGVYCLVDNTGKRYIGSSKDIQKRAKEHHSQLSTNTHTNYLLREASANGNQFTAHVIELVKLENGESIYTELERREQHFIDTLSPEYNIAKYVGPAFMRGVKRRDGGSRLGATLTPEHKEKVRQANLGRKATEETRRRLSESHRGIKQSTEQIQKRNESMKITFQKNMELYGKKHPPRSALHRARISASRKGKAMSTEAQARATATRRKTMEENLQKYGYMMPPKSEETRRKISLAKRGKSFTNSGQFKPGHNSHNIQVQAQQYPSLD